MVTQGAYFILSEKAHLRFANAGHDIVDAAIELWIIPALEYKNFIHPVGGHCVVPLCRYLQSERSHQQGTRREMAARIIADLAQPASIGDLIELLNDTNPQVRSSMARGLSRLTKQTMDFTEQQWQNADNQQRQRAITQWKTWWKKNQARYPESLPVAKK